MITTYTLFKFLHIACAIVWVGGVFALVALNMGMGRLSDPVAGGALATLSEWFGRVVLGPSAGLTLATGIVLAVLFRGGFLLWMMWGLAGVVVSVLIGAAFQGRAALRLAAVMAAGETPAVIAAARRHVRLLALANLLVLFSTVAVMVMKPTI